MRSLWDLFTACLIEEFGWVKNTASEQQKGTLSLKESGGWGNENHYSCIPLCPFQGPKAKKKIIEVIKT